MRFAAIPLGIVLVVFTFWSLTPSDPVEPPADPATPLDPCKAVLAEDPEVIARWLADRNGVTIERAREAVALATSDACHVAP